jgi:hypothetical protein
LKWFVSKYLSRESVSESLSESKQNIVDPDPNPNKNYWAPQHWQANCINNYRFNGWTHKMVFTFLSSFWQLVWVYDKMKNKDKSSKFTVFSFIKYCSKKKQLFRNRIIFPLKRERSHVYTTMWTTMINTLKSNFIGDFGLIL